MLHLLLSVVALCLAVVLGIQASSGDGIGWKILKILGVLVSIVPIIGLIQWLVARGKPSGYGEKCGIMAIVGVVLYVVTRTL
jgi:hypothetical protein